MKHRFIYCLLLSLVVACTQAPSPYASKGSGFYGRGSGGSMSQNPNDLQIEPRFYSTNSPRLKEDHAVQGVPATMGDVGVSELPPPVQTKELPPAKPAGSQAPSQEVPHSGLSDTKAEPLAAADIPIAKPLPAPAVSAEPAIKTAMIWPAEGKIISGFGGKSDGRVNDGINIQAEEGEPIYAAADGTVTYVGNTIKGYGTMALLKHAHNLITGYAHANDIVVKKGDKVKQGQVIGYVGRTGGVKTAQLHFSVREGKTPVDPMRYLGRMQPQAS